MEINEHELKITPASFEEAINLKNAIGKAIKTGKINVDIDKIDIEDLDNIEIPSETIGDIINAVLAVGISKEIEKCFFDCAKRAMIDNTEKDLINRDFFENVDNRQYYYPIMIEIIKVNVLPFFKGLFSDAGGIGKMIKSILRSK